MAITIQEAERNLSLWMSALEATSSGQTYSIGGRSLTRQDIEQIRGEIQRWHNTVTALRAEAEGNARPLGAQAAFPAPGRGAGGIYPQSLWTDWRA